MAGASIRLNAAGIDLSGRIFATTAIVGSPANNGEAVVCRLNLTGTAINLRVRQGSTIAGAVIVDTQAIPASAGAHVTLTGLGLDAAPLGPTATYSLTLEIPNASNPSTVVSVALFAVAV